MCKGTRLLFDPHYSRKNVREPGFLCPFMQVSPHLVYAERWSLEPKNGKSSLLVFGGDQTMSWAFFHHFPHFYMFQANGAWEPTQNIYPWEIWYILGFHQDLQTQKQIPVWSLPFGIQDNQAQRNFCRPKR